MSIIYSYNNDLLFCACMDLIKSEPNTLTTTWYEVIDIIEMDIAYIDPENLPYKKYSI